MNPSDIKNFFTFTDVKLSNIASKSRLMANKIFIYIKNISITKFTYIAYIINI